MVLRGLVSLKFGRAIAFTGRCMMLYYKFNSGQIAFTTCTESFAIVNWEYCGFLNLPGCCVLTKRGSIEKEKKKLSFSRLLLVS